MPTDKAQPTALQRDQRTLGDRDERLLAFAKATARRQRGQVLPFAYTRAANFPAPLAPFTNRCVARVAPT